MMRTVFFLMLFIPLIISAQTKVPPIKPFIADEVKEAKKEAEMFFKAENYNQALKLYERLVVTEPNNADFNFKLGVCYINTNINKAKAVPLLEYAANANTKERPKDVLLELGKAYHFAGLYDKALETYESFREEKKGIVDAKLKFDRWVNYSTSAKQLTENAKIAIFENPGKSVNTPYADYKPIMGVADTVVYFSSKRKGNTGGLTDELGDIPSDIYFFTENDTARSKAKNAGVNLNTAFYEECMFVSIDGSRMLVYKEDAEANGDIFLADIKGKQWNKPVILGKDFATKSLETGACLSPDGLTLFFAAEDPDSKTGKDIYRCTRTESTSWGKPERLGDAINTKDDEDNPYLWIDGKTFFFTSNGHNSMGGYDIFRSVMTDPREGFGPVENIGYPFNSLYDDYGIALASDGKTMYLSAVRDSGLGDYDLYKVIAEQPLVPQPMVWIQGKGITNVGSAAKGAIVVVTDKKSGATMASLETNEATGRFDVAVPAGTYNIVLRHAKLGKAETEVTVDPAESVKAVVDIKYE